MNLIIKEDTGFELKGNILKVGSEEFKVIKLFINLKNKTILEKGLNVGKVEKIVKAKVKKEKAGEEGLENGNN